MTGQARTSTTDRVRRPVAWFIAGLVLAAAQAPHAAPSPTVVISQVYAGGGNTGAPFQNDFIELFNRGTESVSIAGWSIQYASATGTGNFSANGVNALSGTLAPGQYYLVRLAGGAIGAPLPAADGPTSTSSTNMGAAAGKVVLVNTSAGLVCNGGSTVCDAAQLAQIVDLVGWGNANFFEAAAAPGASNTTALFRAAGGCTETDNNAADFSAAAPAPRNTASPLSPCVADVPPSISGTVPTHGAAQVALSANVVVTFSEDVTAAAGAFSISCTNTGSHPVDVTGGPRIFTLNPSADFSSSEACTLTVHAAQVTDQDGSPTAMAADATVTFNTVEACGDPRTSISTIQGSGLQSTMTGASVSIEALVVASYQGSGQFGGYFVQEEDGDGDPATSDGIFVFSSAVPVAAGDKVRIRGTVTEFASSGTFLTELSSVASTQVCSTGNTLPAPVAVMLPVPAVETWERYEGMRITVPQVLTVSETFTLARFGELLLSSGGRLAQPTNVVAPGAPATALQALNDRNRILLDDGDNRQNIDPTLYPAGGLSASNTVRVGDTLNGVTGVLDQRFGEYRLQPVAPVAIAPANPRPAAPAALGGTLRVASMNVLNYFNGNGQGGGFPTERGATTPEEFARQHAKTVATIVAIDADVIGLNEIENDALGFSAIEDLVAGVNAATAPGTYAFIDTGVVGTDAIRVALLYKPATVTPFNTYAILTSAVDPEFIDTLNRPSLAQTFTQNSNGKRLTVDVNHLKSKGSDCLAVNDPDTGDGQGNCNVTRTKAAGALVRWLATDPTGSGDPDVLIVGDMNSYAMEGPIKAVTNAGYTNLVRALVGPNAYSYVFEGQSGYLDHALASPALSSRITGISEWHINADEPVGLDYNIEFKTPNQVNTFYAADPFRSSDHDPVVVGINLIRPYSWTGFFGPVADVNVMNAGRAVPLTFSLGGYRGPDIFKAGSPSSRQMACDGTSAGQYVPTETPGNSTLTYDPASDRYTYVWKTEKQWSGACRQLLLELADGTSHTAIFHFTK